MARADPRTAVPWRSVGAAVAMVTAELADCGVSAADLLDGEDQAEVAATLALITAAVLKMRFPHDQGRGLLRRIGLVALEQDATQTGDRL